MNTAVSARVAICAPKDVHFAPPMLHIMLANVESRKMWWRPYLEAIGFHINGSIPRRRIYESSEPLKPHDIAPGANEMKPDN